MNERVKSYRDIRVWQKAMDLVQETYRVVKQLPREEIYALSDQIRRTAVSIPANIAEGHGRNYTKDYLRFRAIARGSLAELDTLVEISNRLSYLANEDVMKMDQMIQDVRMPLQGLIRSLQRK